MKYIEQMNRRDTDSVNEYHRDTIKQLFSKTNYLRELLTKNDIITADIYGDYKIDYFVGDKYVFIKITTHYDERYYDYALFTPQDQCPIFYRGGKIKW